MTNILPEEVKVNKVKEAKKVEEVKEELKKELKVDFDIVSRPPIYHDLYLKAQNLINALEEKEKIGSVGLLYEPNKAMWVGVDYGKKDYTAESKCRKEGDNLIFEEIKITEPNKSIWEDVVYKLYSTKTSSADIPGAIKIIVAQVEQNTKDIAELKRIIKEVK